MLITLPLNHNHPQVRPRRQRRTDKVEPRVGRLKQLLPIFKLALVGILNLSHAHILGSQPHLLGSAPDLTRRGHNVVTNHNLGAPFQGWYKSSQDADRVLIRPIVEDPAEEVYVCPFDRLIFAEKVMGHEAYSFAKRRDV